MKLSKLLQGVEITARTVCDEIEIGEVRYDSRTVQPGDLFVAIRGLETDGHAYIASALQRGAAAIVSEEAQAGVPAVVTPNTRRALAQIGANRFGHPAEKLRMVGVTGTNGKTTVTYLIKHILAAQGAKVGLVGTNQNLIGEEVIPTERTTPESYALQGLLRQMVDAGCTHAVMEVSSHALALDRVHGIRFAVGVFTNLTQDHLDFHESMEEYRRAKAALFQVCDHGVINIDDPVGRVMQLGAACPVDTFSAQEDSADLTAKDIRLQSDCVNFVVSAEEGIARVHLGIPGQFSVMNALAALGACRALGVPLAQAAKAMRTAQGVKGRVEVVPTDTDYTVLIDYAHSPDGVENVLRAVRGFTAGRVIALFGCGGDRDRSKRPKMGEIAARLADFCIVTSDNPRTEQPEAIIADIVAGMQESKTPREVIVSRPEAIHFALHMAQAGDTLVLMGKGHETYQEIDHVRHHLDEREIIAGYFGR